MKLCIEHCVKYVYKLYCTSKMILFGNYLHIIYIISDPCHAQAHMMHMNFVNEQTAIHPYDEMSSTM